MDWQRFSTILATRTRVASVSPDDRLFGAGLNMSSVAFLEAIMEMEEVTGHDIDIDSLDASIKTAGQLYARLFPG